MTVQIWTYIIVALTFALYIAIAIWSRAGSTKEFYVAGGGVSKDEIGEMLGHSNSIVTEHY